MLALQLRVLQAGSHTGGALWVLLVGMIPVELKGIAQRGKSKGVYIDHRKATYAGFIYDRLLY